MQPLFLFFISLFASGAYNVDGAAKPPPTLLRPPSPRPLPPQPSPQPPQPSPQQADPLPLPEAGLIPLPWFKTYYFPGPSPSTYSQPFNLSMPEGNNRTWYLEEESGKYRAPQHRIVYGPIASLPSVLLLEGVVDIGGAAKASQTQGALFMHQRLYYDGGSEFGWVWYCRDKKPFYYNVINNAEADSGWWAKGTANVSYIGQYTSFRLQFDSRNKMTNVLAVIKQSNSSVLNNTYAWPSWLKFNATAPWYVTMTWMKDFSEATNNTNISASLTNARVWYKP